MLRNQVAKVIALAAPLLASAPAFGQVACGDSTCPRGYSCATETEQRCPTIYCETNCPPCEWVEHTYCKAEPCSSDSDCDVGMICTENAEQAFGEPACDGGSCPTRGGSEACATPAARYCMARWRLECVDSADCGEGFKCEPQQVCSCEGSATGGGNAAASNYAETCSCTHSGKNACSVQEVGCASDADCPAGFSCENNGTASSSGAHSSSGEPSPDKVCSPPYDALSRAGDGSIALEVGSKFVGEPDAAPPMGVIGGCSIAQPGAPAGVASLIAVLGAAVGLSRRRRR